MQAAISILFVVGCGPTDSTIGSTSSSSTSGETESTSESSTETTESTRESSTETTESMSERSTETTESTSEGSDSHTSTDDEGAGDSTGQPCVCDAFGPPGLFDPSVCDDGSVCCDHDGDGLADPEPTRLICF